MKNLNSTEKGLESVGLKLKTDIDYKNGLSTTTYSWNETFLKDYFSSHPSTTEQDIIPPLENYVNVANAYTQKYSSPFNLKKTDGSVEASQLLDSVKKEIDAKVSLANQTITNLKEL